MELIGHARSDSNFTYIFYIIKNLKLKFKIFSIVFSIFINYNYLDI